MGKGLRAILMACLVLLLCRNGQAGKTCEPTFDLWPLIRCWASEDGLMRGGEALGPIIEWHDTPESRAFYLRPLYNRRDDKPAGVIESEWPWPLGFGTHRPDLERAVVFPLFLHEREKAGEAELTRTALLPLFYRRTVPQRSDLLVFPFGGVVHDLLGREKIVLVLWPIFVYQKGRDVRSWSVLHPIFSLIKWDDGGSGLRVWPLFGVNRRPDRLDKVFILWPFYHSQYARIEQGELRRWWLFPFYGRIEEPGGWEWAALWPFFGQRYEKAPDQKVTWCPWPLLGFREGGRVNGWSFWPIYSVERRPEVTSGYFLWPLGWYRKEEKADQTRSSFRLIPLMFSERETRGEVSTEAWQAWPLVKRRHEADGTTQLEVPSLLPARLYAPWERNFAPFFRLFELHETPDGTRSWRALWRMVRVDAGPGQRCVEIAPLFRLHVESAEAPRASWSVLKGLVGVESSAEGRHYRLFYALRFGVHKGK